VQKGHNGLLKRFSAINDKKGINRPNFISFYTNSSLSLAQKWVTPITLSPRIFQKSFPSQFKKKSPPLGLAPS
jgi:hypothetical protein